MRGGRLPPLPPPCAHHCRQVWHINMLTAQVCLILVSRYHAVFSQMRVFTAACSRRAGCRNGRSSSRHRLVSRHGNAQRRITRICAQLLVSANTSLLAGHRRRLEMVRGSLSHRHRLWSAVSLPTSVRLLCETFEIFLPLKMGGKTKVLGL